MDSYFQSPYDSELSFALFKLYKDGNEDVLNELMSQMCSLVNKVFSYTVGKSRDFDKGEVEATALERAYLAILRKGIPTTHHRVFSRYVATILQRSMYSTLKSLDTQKFDYRYACAYTPVSQLIDISNVESSIYRAQLKKLLYKKSVEKIRMIGSECEACEYIVRSLSGLIKMSSVFARRKFNIDNRRFRYLVRYSSILIRSSLWDIHEYERSLGTLEPSWKTS